MNGKITFLIILIFALSLSIAAVSADDVNSTDSDDSNGSLVGQNSLDNNYSSDEAANSSENADSSNQSSFNDTKTEEIIKTTPKISISSKYLKSKDTLNIYLKDGDNNPLKSKKVSVFINNKNKTVKTNSKGVASFNINLNSKTYKMTISFAGDSNYNSVLKKFTIKVSKLKTTVTRFTNFVIKGKNIFIYLYDQFGNAVSKKKLTLKYNNKNYVKKTNKYGRVSLKIRKSSTFTVKAKFKADKQYKSSSNTFKYYIVSSKSLKIGNSKLLTNGYLRIYLKDSLKSQMSKKTITVKIAGKKFTKKTNSEGIVVIKPKVKAKTYKVYAKQGKYYVSKKLKCIDAKVQDPLENNISLKNGVPDIDVMPGNYVMGDNSATYTLTKAQYRDVIKRDSYCLFLNNKLSKYTFFKTKSHPNLNHIIKREKWNVIERAINLKIVSKNKHNYWPGEITVSLKGKSYTYPEVRDSQGTSYTCGPTSASVCSQVLRNYICERQLAKQMGTNSKDGTKCEWIVSGLEKNNFKCTYFYKASFDDALDELKKGGCALIFHTKRHYVSILDISKDGKKVLVSNSYGNWYNIPTKWLTVKYMKTRFYKWEDSLIVRLNYNLSKSKQNSVNCFYNSMGTKWVRQNTHENIVK